MMTNFKSEYSGCLAGARNSWTHQQVRLSVYYCLCAVWVEALDYLIKGTVLVEDAMSSYFLLVCQDPSKFVAAAAAAAPAAAAASPKAEKKEEKKEESEEEDEDMGFGLFD